jgi:transposase
MARASRAEWAKRVERWKDSGLSAKQFATEIGVSAQSLTFWSWKLRKPENSDGAPTARRMDTRETRTETQPKFLQLVPAAAVRSAPSVLELVLGQGVVLRVASGFDEPTLLRLVELLGGR